MQNASLHEPASIFNRNLRINFSRCQILMSDNLCAQITIDCPKRTIYRFAHILCAKL